MAATYVCIGAGRSVSRSVHAPCIVITSRNSGRVGGAWGDGYSYRRSCATAVDVCYGNGVGAGIGSRRAADDLWISSRSSIIGQCPIVGGATGGLQRYGATCTNRTVVGSARCFGNGDACYG